MQAINKNIKKLRRLKGLNQSDFAQLFDLSRANIGSYEEGRAQPKIDTVTKMAKYFSISLDDFVNKELTVNDLSGFNEPTSNQVQVSPNNQKAVVTIPYIEQDEIRKFLSLGKSKNQVSIPKEHGADFALKHAGHSLEGIDGISEGDILLLKRVQVDTIQHGYIHAFWHKKEMTVGISFIDRTSIELRGIQKDAVLDSIPIEKVDKVWRLQSVISSKQRNYEHILLNNRISELEETLKKFMSENK